MEKRRLGRTGLMVSSLGLGTLTWGRDTDLEQASEQLRMFLDAGGNLLDTATTYGEGESEKLIGTLLDEEFSRDDLVICSKAGVRAGDPPSVDASRANLLRGLDQTLERLGTAYIDVWFVHHYDPFVRVEETLTALEMALRSGRARYVGVSNYPAWALAELAVLLGQDRYEVAAVQGEYSLVNRQVEEEVLGAAEHFDSSFIAWSPLGRGVLTGKYQTSIPPDSRAASPHLQGFVSPYLSAEYQPIIEAVLAGAEGLEWDPLKLALAWVKDAPGVTSALTGARSAQQFAAILKAADAHVPHQIRVALNEASE